MTGSQHRPPSKNIYQQALDGGFKGLCFGNPPIFNGAVE
jgi:hypothetical protein